MTVSSEIVARKFRIWYGKCLPNFTWQIKISVVLINVRDTLLKALNGWIGGQDVYRVPATAFCYSAQYIMKGRLYSIAWSYSSEFYLYFIRIFLTYCQNVTDLWAWVVQCHVYRNQQINCFTSKFTAMLVQTASYLLTPRSRVLLEKLTGSASSQEIPRIFGTRRFITVFTSARHLSLSWAKSSEPALYRLLTFYVPKTMSLFRSLLRDTSCRNTPAPGIRVGE